jgi:hypothetical protein
MSDTRSFLLRQRNSPVQCTTGVHKLFPDPGGHIRLFLSTRRPHGSNEDKLPKCHGNAQNIIIRSTTTACYSDIWHCFCFTNLLIWCSNYIVAIRMHLSKCPSARWVLVLDWAFFITLYRCSQRQVLRNTDCINKTYFLHSVNHMYAGRKRPAYWEHLTYEYTGMWTSLESK